MQLKLILILLAAIVLIDITNVCPFADAAEPLVAKGRFSKLENLFSSFKQASVRGAGLARDLAVSIPFTKILLAGGAVLSLLFFFARLLVVLGPILLLGALTRESTDTRDAFRMVLEFFDQVIIALAEQMNQSPDQAQSAWTRKHWKMAIKTGPIYHHHKSGPTQFKLCQRLGLPGDTTGKFLVKTSPLKNINLISMYDNLI